MNYLQTMKKIVLYIISLVCFVNCSLVQDKHSVLSSNRTAKTNDSIRDFNAIDKLELTDDVVKFVKSVNPKFAGQHHGDFKIHQTDSIYKNFKKCSVFKDWEIKNWEKIDLNNDGKTDLLFIAYWPNQYAQYAIIDSGNSIFDLVLISTKLNYCKLVKPIKIDKKTELLLYDYRTQIERTKKDSAIHYIDTLTYKFGSLIEKNRIKKQDYNIESINFNVRNHFSLEIDNQGNAYYNCPEKIFMNRLYENNYVGKSNKKIPIEKFDELEQILKYINVKDLLNTYEVDSSDHTTVILTIKFKDGSIKEITDYGSDGSYGLNAVYSKLTKIAIETDWK